MKVVEDPTVHWVADNWYPAGQSLPAPGSGVDVAVLGIPFDHAVSHRPGTRFGPTAIAAALRSFSMYCTDKRVSLDGVRFLDFGQVDVVHSFQETYRRVREAVRDLPSGVHPVFLGGDHSLTDPIIRGLQDRAHGPRFGIIDFDAHFDSREPISGKQHSGNWMYTLRDVIDYRVVAQLGINAPIYSEHYMRAAEEAGVLVRTPYEIRRRGWASVVEEAVSHASRGVDGVYISIDIDCLDQSCGPGTSVPNPCGLMAYELIDAVFDISRQTEVVGLDISEVSPPLDTLDNTAQVAAHAVLNHVAGVVARHIDRGEPVAAATAVRGDPGASG